jgi:hypothetical protein
MFRHRHQCRRWATCVLLLWLLGVGAGVANACLAATATQPGSPSIAKAVSLVGLHHGVAAPEGAHDHGPSQGHEHAGHTGYPAPPGSSSCQHFCDTAGISIPSQKSAFDDVHGNALFLLPAATAVVLDPGFAPVQQWVPRWDSVRAPPIQIAFMRLAL